MVALAGQRAQFTWALNEYNKTDDPGVRSKFVRHIAASIRNAKSAGFTKEQVTRDKSYPAEEVEAAVETLGPMGEPDVTEIQVKEALQNSVDSASSKRKGTGNSSVYVYGYRCAPDRLTIGYTDGDVVERIADQIGTSTPDKPVLFLEIRTNNSRALERALHSILIYRGKKILGGGVEWFLVNVNEIEHLCELIGEGILASSDSQTLQNPAETAAGGI
jgi:T5orf172 domain